MCSRNDQSTPHSTHPPDLPEPTGPDDDRFVFHVTEKGHRALAEYKLREVNAEKVESVEATDCSLVKGLAATSERKRLEEAEKEAERAAKMEARRAARERRKHHPPNPDLRRGTVSYLNQGASEVPFIRLAGKWVHRAGFAIGQRYEVDVEPGKLTLRTV